MKQILLVAGVDFEFHGVDFRSLADNRRALLERKNTKHDDLRFITMDVRSGQVEVRDITFPSGKRTETVASTTPFTPVTQASYGTNAAGQVRLKPALYTVMSITDVYARVRDIGSKDPGTLVELSFFSHGWMGGPILANSNDDRLMTLMIPNPFGPATPMTVAVTGNARDPDDKDARGHLDFVAPTMDPPALKLFKDAFASDGYAWLWGCAFPKVIHHALWAMEQSKDYKSSGLGQDVVVHMPAVTADDVTYLEQILAPKLGTFPSRSSLAVQFKYLRWAFFVANQMSYAYMFTVMTGIEVRAAALGTYAEYDTAGDKLMNVYSGFTAHFNFYKNYLGMTFDPEGRRYAVYTSALTCPVP